jgi:hypothetical protein
LLEQANFRFATPATLPQLGHFRFWMVEAVIDTIDPSASRANSEKHRPLECLQHSRLQMPFSNSGLIRDNRDAQTEII